MPIYDFSCENCTHEFERLTKIDETPPRCEQCGGVTHRLIGPSSFRLKGTGWYETDFKGKNNETGRS